MYTEIILIIIAVIFLLFLLEIIKIRKLLQGSDGGAKIEQADKRSDDELFDEAKKIVIASQEASVSLLQRKLRIGYNRAAILMDLLEEEGVIKSAR